MKIETPDIGSLHRRYDGLFVMVVEVLMDPEDGLIKIGYEYPEGDKLETKSVDLAEWFGWYNGAEGLEWPPVRRYEPIKELSLAAVNEFEPVEESTTEPTRASKLDALERARKRTKDHNAPIRLVPNTEGDEQQD